MALTTLNVADLDGADGFVLRGEATGSETGIAVDTAGDFNGDGIDDMIVGARGLNGNEGAAYVVFGGASFSGTVDLDDLDGTDGFRLTGETSGDLAGQSVATVGDINADELADIVIGANGNDEAAYIIFGSSSSLSASVDLGTLDGNDGFKISGSTAGAELGIFVNQAGDIDGDGIDDVILGAPGFAKDAYTSSGGAYVVYGDSSAFSAELDLSLLDASEGFVLSGDTGDNQIGRAVGGGGDFNDDGVEDALVGSQTGSTIPDEGFIVFGNVDQPYSGDLNQLAAGEGVILDGFEGNFGSFPILNAGDVNGDGVDDIIVGSTDNPFDNTTDNDDFAYVVFGGSGLDTSAGFDVSTLDGSDGFRLETSTTGTFGLAVDTAGDFNGDGFDDFIVGNSFAGGTGEAYLIFGGLSFGASLVVDTLASTAGLRIVGESASDEFAELVSTAGDVNGDGFADIIIGAQDGESGRGSASIIFGYDTGAITDLGDDTANTISGDGTDNVMFGGDGDDVLSGLAGDDVIRGGAGADDLDGGADADRIFGDAGADDIAGGAGDDILEGGSGNDEFSIGAGADRVDGGAGDDTIVANQTELGAGDRLFGGSGNEDVLDLTGATGTTDLSGLAAFAGIEQILLAANQSVNGGDFNVEWIGGSGDQTFNLGGGADEVRAGAGVDTVNGGGGDDELRGQVGDDILNGQAGDDVLRGADDNDRLDGGAGDDILRGGTGDDTYVVDSAGDVIIESSGTDSVESSVTYTLISGVENLTLTGSSNIDGTGNSGANVMTGNSGTNTIKSGGGADTINGGGGLDLLRGQVGDDVINGGDGDDNIRGAEDDDTIDGGNGADFIDGGTEDDILTGGAGVDTFFFDVGDGVDQVTDFNVTADLIDLTNFAFANFAAVQAAITETAGTSTIDLGSGQTVELTGVTEASIGAEDILI